MNHGSSRLNFKFGFTIVELLVVIVVIGILAAITIVSYSGITNRATISSLQSDLTNASTVLKLDQITGNDSFPTTLALANGGKGITPSQTMDSVIYVPDNTSNPKNFCLQYRKGTNTYAVDNTSSPSKGVCLANLVSNGDFRNGTTGWDGFGYAALTASGGILTATTSTDPGWNISHFTDSNIPIITGNKIYVRAKAKNATGGVILAIRKQSTSSPITSVENVTANAWYTMSAVWDTTGSTGGFGLRVDRISITTIGDVMQVQYVLAIDLTVAFGAGNEPTKVQMDTIMSNYPNSWFNIVAKANL